MTTLVAITVTSRLGERAFHMLVVCGHSVSYSSGPLTLTTASLAVLGVGVACFYIALSLLPSTGLSPLAKPQVILWSPGALVSPWIFAWLLESGLLGYGMAFSGEMPVLGSPGWHRPNCFRTPKLLQNESQPLKWGVTHWGWFRPSWIQLGSDHPKFELNQISLACAPLLYLQQLHSCYRDKKNMRSIGFRKSQNWRHHKWGGIVYISWKST